MVCYDLSTPEGCKAFIDAGRDLVGDFASFLEAVEVAFELVHAKSSSPSQ